MAQAIVKGLAMAGFVPDIFATNSVTLNATGGTFWVQRDRDDTDAYGHAKLGGIGDLISERLKDMTAKLNNGRSVDTVTQKLGYLVRCGDPDAIDSIVPETERS